MCFTEIKSPPDGRLKFTGAFLIWPYKTPLILIYSGGYVTNIGIASSVSEDKVPRIWLQNNL